MSRNVLCVWGLLIATGTLATGCAKAPQQAVQDARAAVDSARVAEALLYAPEQYRAAADSLDAAMAAITQEESRNALRRNFGVAERQLQAAESAARTAVTAAAENKAKAIARADEQLAMLQQGIENARNLLGQAPKGKDGAAALESIKTDLTAVELSLVQATEARDKADYLGAAELAGAAAAKAQSLSAELTQAIEKKKLAKR